MTLNFSINEDIHYVQKCVRVYHSLVAVISITSKCHWNVFYFFFINNAFIFVFDRCGYIILKENKSVNRIIFLDYLIGMKIVVPENFDFNYSKDFLLIRFSGISLKIGLPDFRISIRTLMTSPQIQRFQIPPPPSGHILSQ